MKEVELLLAGHGGQGVLVAGQTLCHAAVATGLHATWVPSYGAEVRGGTANCMVVISEEEIASPVVLSPDILVVFNSPSYTRFANSVKNEGFLIVNSTLVKTLGAQKPVRTLEIPLSQLADELGDGRVANLVCLGALVEFTKVLPFDCLVKGMERVIGKQKSDFWEINEKALLKGRSFVSSQGNNR